MAPKSLPFSPALAVILTTFPSRPLASSLAAASSCLRRWASAALGLLGGDNRARSGLPGRLSGEEEVAGKAVADLYDLPLLAGAFHILRQNHFHDGVLLIL